MATSSIIMGGAQFTSSITHWDLVALFSTIVGLLVYGFSGGTNEGGSESASDLATDEAEDETWDEELDDGEESDDDSEVRCCWACTPFIIFIFIFFT